MTHPNIHVEIDGDIGRGSKAGLLEVFGSTEWKTMAAEAVGDFDLPDPKRTLLAVGDVLDGRWTIVGVTAYGEGWSESIGFLLLSTVWCVIIFAAGILIYNGLVQRRLRIDEAFAGTVTDVAPSPDCRARSSSIAARISSSSGISTLWIAPSSSRP